jgi:hypothetical protein
MRSVMSYVCSLYQMDASFTKWNLYGIYIRVVEKSTTLWSCRKIYNSDALSTKPTNSYVSIYNVIEL